MQESNPLVQILKLTNYHFTKTVKIGPNSVEKNPAPGPQNYAECKNLVWRFVIKVDWKCVRFINCLIGFDSWTDHFFYYLNSLLFKYYVGHVIEMNEVILELIKLHNPKPQPFILKLFKCKQIYI